MGQMPQLVIPPQPPMPQEPSLWGWRLWQYRMQLWRLESEVEREVFLLRCQGLLSAQPPKE